MDWSEWSVQRITSAELICEFIPPQLHLVDYAQKCQVLDNIVGPCGQQGESR